MSSHTDLALRTALIVITIMVLIGLAWLLIQVTAILIMVLIAAILATGLGPIVETVQRRRWTRRKLTLSRTWAILLVYLGVLIVVGAIAGLVVTPVVLEAQGFVANLPDNLSKLEMSLADLRARYTWLPDMASLVKQLPEELGRITDYFAPAAGVAVRVLGGVATVITVLFLAFYMLVEGPIIKQGFLALFPKKTRSQISDVLEEVGAKFGGWLRGQLVLSAIIGVAAAAGMAAIDMPYPVLLGIVAGVTELIPMIGPTLGAIPAVFLALFQPGSKLIFTIVWYIVIQQAEGNIIVPRVMRHAVGLSPLLTIIALVTGAKLLGLIGALLAIPVAAALQVVVGEILERVRPEE